MKFGSGGCCCCFSSNFYFLLNGNASKFMIENCWNVATPCMFILHRGLWTVAHPKKEIQITIPKKCNAFFLNSNGINEECKLVQLAPKNCNGKTHIRKLACTHTHFDLSAITIKIESNCNLLRLIKICDTFCSVVIWCEPCSSLFFSQSFFSFASVSTERSGSVAHTTAMKNGF